MARKRVSQDPIILSGAAPAPVRRKPSTTRTVRAAAATETSTPDETQAAVAPEEPGAEVPSSAVATPTYQEIAALAYSYWVARGQQGGSPEEDWLRAEQELSVK
jgi:Protein of unknown function (DUF2934)